MSEDQDQGERRSVDDHVSVRSHPPITSTTHILPFERLSPLDFERLCLWLVEREGYTRAEHLGLAGSEQGRDVIAYKPTSQGEELWYFQCKRYRSIRAKTLKDEVDKYLEVAQEKPHLKPFGVVFVTSCAVSADAREEVGAYCEQHSLAYEFWALTELDLRIKRYPDLLREFFGLYTRPIGIPFQAPPLPPHFVPRPEVSDALKARLLADEAAAPGVLVVSAIHGLGGIGKTTLAAHLAYDPDTQTRFPDGILWAALGQQPDVLSLLTGWIQALGDYDFHPTTVEIATSRLRTLLHNKACLLVVDDAWQADHARAFLAGSEHCRVLITTRDATLARKVGARLYDLDVMTKTQALALFEAWLGPLDGDYKHAAALAEELGYLPLALELAAAQIEGGISWVELLDTFRQELADLAALDLDEATYRNESLRLSFRLSLERLAPEDQEAFAWLGVLPEDARLDPAMASTLWDEPERETLKRLRRLRDRALLKRAGNDQYTIHDLLHNEAKLCLAEQMPLADAHAALLNRYRQQTTDGRWHTLPDDDYVYEYLTWHLEQAGWTVEIHLLVAGGDQEQAWSDIRWQKDGHYAGYLFDLDRAWKTAYADKNVGYQVRYALIRSSIHSIASNFIPELVVALTEHKFPQWTPTSALSTALQIPESEQRTRALCGILPYLPTQMRAGILDYVPRLERESDQATLLINLAPYLPADLLARAFESTSTLKDTDLVTALKGLAPHLTSELLEQAIGIALKLPFVSQERRGRVRFFFSQWDWDSLAKVDALCGIAPHVEPSWQEKLISEALEKTKYINDSHVRALACYAIAPHLEGADRTRILRLAAGLLRNIGDKDERDRVLESMALSQMSRGRKSAALETASRIQGGGMLSRVLSRLAPQLPRNLLLRALEMARHIDSEEHRLRAFHKLGLCLPVQDHCKVLEEALELANHIENSHTRNEALSLLVHNMAVLGKLEEAISLAHELWREERIRALCVLASYVPDDNKVELLEEALSIARAIEDDLPRIEVLASLVPLMPDHTRSEAVETVLQLMCKKRGKYVWIINDELMKLAPHIPPRLMTKALTAVREGRHGPKGFSGFRAIIRHLPPDLLDEAQEIAYGIGNESFLADYKDEVLVDLSIAFAKTGRLDEAIIAVDNIVGEAAKSEALGAVAELVSEAQLGSILSKAHKLIEPAERAACLAKLALRLSHPEQIMVLSEALDATSDIASKKERVATLCRVMPYLGDSEREQAATIALEAALELGSGFWLLDSCVPLLPFLSVKQRTTALMTVLDEIVNNYYLREGYLASHFDQLIPWLPDELKPRALEVILGCDEYSQLHGVICLLPHLSEPEYSKALQAALEISNTSERFTLNHADLIQALPEPERGELLMRAINRITKPSGHGYQPPNRYWDIASLAPVWVDWYRSSPKEAYDLWYATIRQVSLDVREHLLRDIQGLLPVIAAMGGEEAIAEVFRAIQDVGRWWP